MPNAHAQCLILNALLASSLSNPQHRSAALSKASAATRAGHSRAAARSTATFTSALTTPPPPPAPTPPATPATTAAAQFADDFDNIVLRPTEGPSIEAMGEMMPVLIKLRKVAT